MYVSACFSILLLLHHLPSNPTTHIERCIFTSLCRYIVFDVQLLATRLDVDDYIWGSVSLYLDVVNLFLYILRLLGDHDRS